MRGQAAMEFVLVFVFAFVLFIILVGVFATSTIGFADRSPREAALVLDVVALHVSALSRLDAADEVEITFTIPEGELEGAVFETDLDTLRITRDDLVLATRVIPELAPLSDIDVVGIRTLRSDSGVISLE